eukprot:7122801-Prymnesium_polylepis.1
MQKLRLTEATMTTPQRAQPPQPRAPSRHILPRKDLPLLEIRTELSEPARSDHLARREGIRTVSDLLGCERRSGLVDSNQLKNISLARQGHRTGGLESIGDVALLAVIGGTGEEVQLLGRVWGIGTAGL